MTESKAATTSKAVDQAFQRLYGFAWGSAATTTPTTTLPQDLVDIFGSKEKVARILRLPSIAGHAPKNPPKDAAMLLTKRIASTSGNNKRKATTTTTSIICQQPSVKRVRLSEEDYKDIDLPTDIIAAKEAAECTVSASVTKTVPTMALKKPASKLDSVLEQIAGPKKQNTVEKTSNDWENFKEQDKQLQDELELQAQSKNAYLVKQDFLTRVDQRRFEIEKEERDQERSRRQLAQASAKK